MRDQIKCFFSLKNTYSAAPGYDNAAAELGLESAALEDPKDNIGTLMAWLDDHLYHER